MPRGLTVGYYDPETNRTTDARGLKVAEGNVLAALIMQAENWMWTPCQRSPRCAQAKKDVKVLSKSGRLC